MCRRLRQATPLKRLECAVVCDTRALRGIVCDRCAVVWDTGGRRLRQANPLTVFPVFLRQRSEQNFFARQGVNRLLQCGQVEAAPVGGLRPAASQAMTPRPLSPLHEQAVLERR